MSSVFVKGAVGNLGTKVLIENRYDELAHYYNDGFLKKVMGDIESGLDPLLFMKKKVALLDDKSIVDSIDISKGGFLAALWKICEKNKCGIRYSIFKVPILQGTIEIANYFDINPYRLLTKDSKIFFVDDRDFNATDDKDIYEGLSYIGDTTDDNKRVRIDNDIESFLTKDYKDDIDKALPKYIKNYETYSNS